MNKTIAIGIPSGQATRDVIHSGILENLLSHSEVKVVVVTPAKEEVSHLVLEFGERVVVEGIGYYQPTLVERLLRSIYFSSLYYKSRSIRDGIRAGQLRSLVFFVNLIQWSLGARRFLAILDWINRRAGDSSQCANILRKHQVDLCVLTRVFNFSADYQLLKEGYKQGIPTVALVSSWDNLTTKGFFPFGVDDIVVWNEIMRQEAIDLFDFPSSRIHIVGVPRFDHCFRRTTVRDRNSFLSDFGLDPSKKTITYTTANRGLLDNPAVGKSPEVEIVKFLASQIEANAFGVPAQLLVRLHPLADLIDFQEVAELDCVRLHYPGKVTNFRDRFLDLQEERMLAETMCYSDVVINIASTIVIDAAIFDTPVICVQFDWFDSQPYESSTKRFYAQDHIKKIASTNGYRPVDSSGELISAIRDYLDDPSRDCEGRAAIIKQQCHFSDGQSSNRVATLLLQKLGIDSRVLEAAA
jgi:hypothetical protein